MKIHDFNTDIDSHAILLMAIATLSQFGEFTTMTPDEILEHLETKWESIRAENYNYN